MAARTGFTSGSGPCPDRAEQRSALLDGALSGGERDDLLRHLVGCARCRADLAELRRVRDRLRGADPAGPDPARPDPAHPDLARRVPAHPDLARPAPAHADPARPAPAHPDPAGLSARLVSIAGPQAYEPLYSRPFTTAERRMPPSRRTTRRSQAVAATMLVTSLAMAALLVGYVAAPSSLAPLDPAARARAEFGTALGSLPLGSEAMSAVVLDDRVGPLRIGAGDGAIRPGPGESAGTPLGRAALLTVLDRALRALGGISLTGELYVGVGSGDDRVEASVGVVAQAGQGAELTIRTLAGSVVDEVFQPYAATDPATALAVLGRLSLTGRTDQQVAGWAATRVSATAADGSSRSWWIDDATGLVLWQEARGPDGALQSSSGYVTLAQNPEVFLGHLAPRLAVPCATVSVPTAALTSTGWRPAATLAGLPLTAVLVDDPAAPTVVHAVYGDGVSVLSVVQQLGSLQRGLAGYSQVELDASTLMWTRGTAGTRFATWQSGHAVFSVTTTGSAHLLRTAVLALPRAAEPGDSRLDRVRAGWTRILRLVLG